MVDNQRILLKFIQIHTNVNWYDVSYKYILSENFIRKFQDKVNWVSISIHQKLSENFIIEFQDKVNLDLILTYQTLSEDFKKRI